MINTIIFDLGGVLVDWNPRYLYRKIFKTEEEITWFLENVCTQEWNAEQDAGRSFEDASAELIAKFPHYEEAIRACYDRWPETISGPLDESVDILKKIKEMKQHRLYALTNWSAETFPFARQRFEFLKWFEGIVVSGAEKTRKPFPEIYNIILSRYSIVPHETVFIDDVAANIDTARSLGIDGIHFQGAKNLKEELFKRGISLTDS